MATPFKLRSGNASTFKNMGSSPVKVDLPEVTVTDKKDVITLEKPTKEQLEKAKKSADNKESSDGQTTSMKVNQTTGESKMVNVVSNRKKFDERKASEQQVYDYNVANKGKPGHKAQTFADNISEDNKYIN